MDDDDRELLLRVAKLAEDNNRMLRRIKRSLFWGEVWGLIKIAIIVIPLIIGYLYLEPYLGPLSGTLSHFQGLGQGK